MSAHVSRTAFITGASSGIGLGLAEELARRGWRVALAARRFDRIAEAAARIGDRGFAVACDVTDRDSVRLAVAAAEEALGPIDLAVANAGVGVPTHGAHFNLDNAELMIRTNVLGMMYLYDATIPGMIARKSGRFVGVASIAGLRALPGTGAYSASKAAMQAFLEAARVDLSSTGVGVTTVNPGFVTTEMTAQNKFKMPFLMDADRAVRIIADGIEREARVIEFPRIVSLLARSLRLMPDFLFDRVTRPMSWRDRSGSKEK